MVELLYKDEVYAIQGAVFDVYREMGSGFLEPVYQECLSLEFGTRNIPFRAQAPLAITYKSTPLIQIYKPDFVCFEQIIIELKASSVIADMHRAQILNYLKATGLKLGLLVNFSAYPKARIERFAL